MVAVAAKIYLRDDNLAGSTTMYAGPQGRVATVTDVVFIDPRHMVVTHLSGQTMHLLRRGRLRRRWKVVDTTITSVFGDRTRTDLASAHLPSGRIATSNCRGRSASIYRFSKRRLRHERDIEIQADRPGFTHGVEFTPDGRHLAIVNSNGSCAVRFYDVETGDEIYAFVEEGLRPKDASFIDHELLVVPMCTGSPTSDPGDQYSTTIMLYRVDLERGTHETLDAIEVPDAHTDGVFNRDGTVWVADQTNDVVKVYALDGDRLAFQHDISGIAFPHGIAIDDHQIAVTSYGDESVNVFDRHARRFDAAVSYPAPRSRRATRRYRRELRGYRAREAEAEGQS